MADTKFCRGCSEHKSLSAFGKRSDRTCGLKSRCRKCLSADLRKKYQNPNFAAKDRARSLKWAKDNSGKHNEKGKRWAKVNPEKVAANWENWYENNKERVRENQRIYENKQYQEDPGYRLKKLLRNRITAAVKCHKTRKKAGSAVRDLGCSIPSLISYMETKFAPGMTWDNHGSLWEVDHVRRLADFDLTDRKQFLEACRYTNLQPLWIEDHKEKTRRDR